MMLPTLIQLKESISESIDVDTKAGRMNPINTRLTSVEDLSNTKSLDYKSKLRVLFSEQAVLLESYIPKIGVLSLLSFLFFQFLNYLNIISINPLEGFCQKSLNLIIPIISMIFIYWRKLPVGFQKLKIIYMYVAISILFSFYSSYMLIVNNGATEWQLNFLISSIILMILLKGKIYLLILILSNLLVVFYLKSTFCLELPKNIYPLIFYTIFLCGLIEYLKVFFKTLELKKIKLLEETNKTLVENAALTTAYVVHEIRNPLHGIMGITKILADSPNFNKTQYIKQIKNIYKELNRLTDFIHELLESSKLKAKTGGMVFEQINLIPIIKKTILDAQKFLNNNKNLTIIFKPTVTDALILGDKLKIHQLLNNILTNAIKYSDKGNITVRIADHIKDNKSYWQITITDQGNGIATSELEYIFEPYARSNNTLTQIGSGLGLAFCKEIVMDHKGFIWAENNKECSGAILTILIPQIDN